MRSFRRAAVLFVATGAAAFALSTAAVAQSSMGPGMGSANKATGGGLEAAAIGQMGDTTVTPPLTPVLDLPALNIDEDAEGRIVMDLPGLKLVGKPKARPAPAPGPAGKLPKTGVNVGDLAAAGMAALAAGGILRRRLALRLASNA